MEEVIKKLEDVLSDYNNDKMSDIQSIATLCKEKLVATLNEEQKKLFNVITTLDSVKTDMLLGDTEEAIKGISCIIDEFNGVHPLRGNYNETDNSNNTIDVQIKREFGHNVNLW